MPIVLLRETFNVEKARAENPKNCSGRDLVVGDVHGCFRTLEHALSSLRFDAHKDWLFGVEDLIDRGPHSDEAVDWIEDRFQAVTLGNHDRAELQWFEAKLRGSRVCAMDWKQKIVPDAYPRWRDALLTHTAHIARCTPPMAPDAGQEYPTDLTAGIRVQPVATRIRIRAGISHRRPILSPGFRFRPWSARRPANFRPGPAR